MSARTGEDCPALGDDAGGEALVLGGVDLRGDAGSHDGDGAALGVEGGRVCGGVDALGEAAVDHHVFLDQEPGHTGGAA